MGSLFKKISAQEGHLSRNGFSGIKKTPSDGSEGFNLLAVVTRPLSTSYGKKFHIKGTSFPATIIYNT